MTLFEALLVWELTGREMPVNRRINIKEVEREDMCRLSFVLVSITLGFEKESETKNAHRQKMAVGIFLYFFSNWLTLVRLSVPVKSY